MRVQPLRGGPIIGPPRRGWNIVDSFILKPTMRASIYTLSFTTFVDDYKLRGRFPSTTTTYLFSSEEQANEYLRYLICEELQYRNDEEDFRSMEFEQLLQHADEYFRGKHVPTRVEWSLFEEKIDTATVPNDYFRPTKRSK
jgi:hypothetical protein